MAKAKQNMKITGKGTGNAFLRGFIKTLHLLYLVYTACDFHTILSTHLLLSHNFHSHHSININNCFFTIDHSFIKFVQVSLFLRKKIVAFASKRAMTARLLYAGQTRGNLLVRVWAVQIMSMWAPRRRSKMFLIWTVASSFLEELL